MIQIGLVKSQRALDNRGGNALVSSWCDFRDSEIASDPEIVDLEPNAATRCALNFLPQVGAPLSRVVSLLGRARTGAAGLTVPRPGKIAGSAGRTPLGPAPG